MAPEPVDDRDLPPEEFWAKWADSDIPPPWFDPGYAGERWNEDY